MQRFKQRGQFNRGRRYGSNGPRRQQQSGSKLHHSMFVRKAAPVEEQEVFTPKNTFKDLPIVDGLKQNILQRGYHTMTPIQDEAIYPLLEGKDVIGLANTGTGKTAAFLIPLIQRILSQQNQRVLIVAPTRELAAQIEDECMLLVKGLPILTVKCIGGAPINRQLGRLQRHPQIVIGTPGRLKDIEQRGKLKFSEFNAVVLDEVDRMLDMGFIRDMRHLLSRLPAAHQSAFFSATLPDSAKGLVHEFLNNPVTVSVKTRDTSASVDQDIIKVAGRAKSEVLYELLQNEPGKFLVFGRTKWGMDKLAKILSQKGMNVGVLHGNKSQGHRQKTLQQFKDSSVKVLLATDIASRGLDIKEVTHVVNYDLPQSYEDYVHRIGRTGRANAVGKAVTLVD